ncbi:uncharacterized protein EV422DRAFT_178567 [Fimicolochytrium jonesii]|uniref:uncharacterized protein n=1 Tax=Fimicolochytrium jonesii TaxID=1396493 RepID=UPI0022FE79CB|nr:uncharacterized protein EV422DRAFT_178567 [Fimicolochytrium jonesii]KAI8818305.1 hypothetical protein EV422DRAFT_178567 [Fimicolochytrium jonesii]
MRCGASFLQYIISNGLMQEWTFPFQALPPCRNHLSRPGECGNVPRNIVETDARSQTFTLFFPSTRIWFGIVVLVSEQTQKARTIFAMGSATEGKTEAVSPYYLFCQEVVLNLDNIDSVSIDYQSTNAQNPGRQAVVVNRQNGRMNYCPLHFVEMTQEHWQTEMECLLEALEARRVEQRGEEKADLEFKAHLDDAYKTELRRVREDHQKPSEKYGMESKARVEDAWEDERKKMIEEIAKYKEELEEARKHLKQDALAKHLFSL